MEVPLINEAYRRYITNVRYMCSITPYYFLHRKGMETLKLNYSKIEVDRQKPIPY